MKKIAAALLATVQRYVHAAQELAESGRYLDSRAELERASRVGRCASKALEFVLYSEATARELRWDSPEMRTLELVATYEDLHEDLLGEED